MAEKDYVKTVYVDGSEPDVDAVHLNNTEDGLDGLYHPEFDDSGTVEGITSFPTFLSTVVKRMNPIAFYKNFKAGMKYVLHTGSLINNGLCTETGKYAADATQLNPNIANTLAWQVAKVNSDLANGQAGVIITLNPEYCESLGWGNMFGGSKAFGRVEIAIKAKKTISAGTIIGTSNKRLLTYVMIQGTTAMTVFDNNIRADSKIEAGQNVDIYIPTAVIE